MADANWFRSLGVAAREAAADDVLAAYPVAAVAAADDLRERHGTYLVVLVPSDVSAPPADVPTSALEPVRPRFGATQRNEFARFLAVERLGRGRWWRSGPCGRCGRTLVRR